MLLSWANKQLERLAETVAPISSASPAHRFQSAIASGDANTAISCFNTDPSDDPSSAPLEAHSILNQSKGTQPIHAASQYCCLSVVEYLLVERRVDCNTFDYGGNTALHYAAGGSSRDPSQPLALVQLLVTKYNASVTVKNAQGQTAYDASTDTKVRQYLLPLQLQQETQTCLDNGGAGLVKGIDLGGCRVQNSTLAPPPMMGAPMPQPVNGQGQPSQMNFSPPPMMNHNPSNAHTPQPSSAPSTATQSFLPPPPYSGGYNSNPSSSRRVIQPDGFHSSSSDVNLQQKYGHIKQEPNPELLPPPSSFPTMPSHPSAAAPTNNNTQPSVSSRSKYLAYDAVSGVTAVLPPPTNNYQASSNGFLPPPPMQNVQVFNPGMAMAQNNVVSDNQQSHQNSNNGY